MTYPMKYWCFYLGISRICYLGWALDCLSDLSLVHISETAHIVVCCDLRSRLVGWAGDATLVMISSDKIQAVVMTNTMNWKMSFFEQIGDITNNGAYIHLFRGSIRSTRLLLMSVFYFALPYSFEVKKQMCRWKWGLLEDIGVYVILCKAMTDWPLVNSLSLIVQASFALLNLHWMDLVIRLIAS